MTISELGIFFGLLLFALPVFIIIRFKLNILRRVLVPFAMMLASTCVIASFLYAASATNSILVQCALALVLFVVSSLLTVGKSRTKVSKLFIPVAAGTFAAIVVTVFYALFLVMGLNNPFVPNFFIPFVGIISGSRVILLVADSQNQYGHVLKDWIKSLKVTFHPHQPHSHYQPLPQPHSQQVSQP